MCNYRELPPPAHLAPYVACLWVRSTGNDEVDLQPRILPDGCIDLIWVGERPPTIAGPATTAVQAMLPAWATIVGVRLRTGAAPNVLGLPSSELLDAEVPLRDVWGRNTPELATRIAELSDVSAKLATVEAIVAGRVADADPPDRLVRAATAWLARHPDGQVGVLGQTLGLSDRQLRRRCEAAIGYGPKTLHRVLRFQRWLRLAQRAAGAEANLATLALESGYADQAHLTREVRRLAGVPPTTLLGDAEYESAFLVNQRRRPVGGVASMSDSFKLGQG
jgi:AraC-like DNA-binding protein